MAANMQSLLCSPCESRDTSSAAVKFCRACQEPLCKECADRHNAFRATKNHMLVQYNGQQSSQINSSDSSKMCTQHPNKQTEFYCGDHGSLVCSLCLLKSESHRRCGKVIEIDIAGKSLLDCKFTDTVRDACLKTASSAESTINEIKKCNEGTSDNLTCLRSEIEGIRSKMLEAFDRQTNHIIQSISGDILDNSSKCADAFHKLGNLANIAKEHEKALENVATKKNATDVFRSVVSVLGRCEETEKEVEQIKSKCCRLNVKFEKSDLVKRLETEQNPLLFCKVEKAAFQMAKPVSSANLLKQDFKQRVALIPDELTVFDTGKTCFSHKQEAKGKQNNGFSMPPVGSVYDFGNTSKKTEIETAFEDPMASSKHQGMASNVPTTSHTELDIELSYCRSFNVPVSYEEGPWFSGIVCLPDERLILSDFLNSQIIMVSDNGNVTEKGIKYKPGSLTVFNQLLVVCLVQTNALLLMKIGANDMEVHGRLQTRSQPKYIEAVDDESILVASKKGKDPWRMELMTLEGQKWHSTLIDVEMDEVYFGCKLAVQHVPYALERFRIIKFCDALDTLQCVRKADGSVVFNYDVEDIASVITDHLGYIFVTGHRGEVQVLSPDGTLVTRIRRSVMQKLKFSAFNESKDKLFISTYKDSVIHVLGVKRRKSKVSAKY